MKPYRESEFKNKKMTDGFNSAIEGVFETIRTEKHMKFHVFTTILVIVLGLFINLSRYELLALIISTSFVWLAELFNTAIECCVDLTCQEYNLLAKKAKDVAAGAVLLSAFNALIIGYLVFSKHIGIQLQQSFRVFRTSYQHKTVLIFIVVLSTVLLIKLITQRGTPLKGGMPSGHSALAASIFTIISFLTSNPKIFYLSFLLLILVIQSRVEGKIHTLFETIVGALLGSSITYIILYFLKYKIWG